MATDIDVKLVSKLTNDFKTSLNFDARREHWVLHMSFDFDSSHLTAVVPIPFFNPAGLFSGTSSYHVESNKSGKATFEADIEGESHENDVELSLFVATHHHRETISTINCSGALVAKGRYEGLYHVPCRNPQGCGCDGTRGAFHLISQTLHQGQSRPDD